MGPLRPVVRGSERSRGKRMQLSERSALATTRRAVAMRSAGPRALLLVSVAAVSTGAVLPAAAADQSFEIYGFAMADFIQDSKRVDPSWQDAFRPSRIATQRASLAPTVSRASASSRAASASKERCPRAIALRRSTSSSRSTCLASASMPARRPSACAMRTASGVRYSPDRRTVCSWTSTYSRTSSTTGVRAAWCSTVCRRFVGRPLRPRRASLPSPLKSPATMWMPATSG